MTDYKEIANRLASYIHQLMDGDTHMVEAMYDFMEEHGYADEDGYPIDDDE